MNAIDLTTIHWAIKDPMQYLWTVQGFGFIRCYFADDKRFRLNVWDSELRTNASMIHDHPWHFSSRVIAGELTNYRYHADEFEGDWYEWALLVPGIDGGLKRSAGGATALKRQEAEVYKPFEQYHQDRREIHETAYRDGTVTVNDRTRPHNSQDLARIYWPAGEEWKDAMPRQATPEEVFRTCNKAKELM